MDEIVAFAELERFIDLPVRTYSSGMYMRLGFAVAAHIEADVLLLDEVFAVGDEEFQRKCFAKIFEFKQRGGTIVFVSHDAASVERLCERAVLLRDGKRRDRRLDAGGDRPVPPAARRGARPGGERRRPDASTAAARRASPRRGCSAPTASRGSSSSPASRSTVELRDRRRARRSRRRASRSSSATRPASCSPPTRRTRPTSAGARRRASASSASRSRSPPLADGRFRLRFELSDPTGRRLYHWLDDGVRFVVYPGEPARGPVLLDGQLDAGETPARRRSEA